MKAAVLLAALAGPGLLAAGALDPAKPSTGERAYQKCYSCHSLEPGRSELEGPTLYGIVGRRLAAEPAFDYSPALERFAKAHPVWTEELVERFIADPEALVPGTTMAFAGMRDPAERAALIDYLRKASEARR